MTKFSAFTSHPGEEILELYCLNRLEEEEAAGIEEHVLLCESCQQRIADLDGFLKAARQATRDLRSEEKYSEPSLSWAWIRRPAWAAAGALALLTIALAPSLRTGSGELQTVELSAYRGAAEEAGGGVATARQPLRLEIDLSGLASENCCTLELVDANGKVVLRTTAAPESGRAAIEASKGLAQGQYWLRVKDSGGQDLRELSLSVN